MKRSDVYVEVHNEREYQDMLYGTKRGHEVGTWLALMRHHLNKAEASWASSTSDAVALGELRKVLGAGFACAEQHGLPSRAAKDVNNEPM